ncbi:DUF5343 domain-containing protein [Salinisphaera sp. P385]|uniref:DUF5343 domain-containing protein n=1 Tax=Spectribacter acetivorans TaxID=3075603 RepID=A0ABU3BAE2_9GAMM|nr:DUF5343 domain-containing protein [Salinisphaera sp. P385]MDT0619010.1 DUF5343 domain-containing protein [Salinisphaera sp. P385]
MANLPYVQATSTLEKMLDQIKTASVPDKFSSDFVAEKLLLKGGNGRSLIPFIKKMGLVSSDGTPTDRYREFRNPTKSGSAIAKAMRELYAPLFQMNEYVQDTDTSKLKGLIVEATGAESNSTVVKKTLSTFQALRERANFESDHAEPDETHSQPEEPPNEAHPSIPIQQYSGSSSSESINLAYTINLNLPATKDIEVFNAIFKSLKQHLLQE